jgi:hypothetical protein
MVANPTGAAPGLLRRSGITPDVPCIYREHSMSTQSEIAATREQLAAVRGRMSDTAADIEALVADRVDAVKDRVNVVQVIRAHPWASLGVALGAGVAIAASGADRMAATATAEASRSAARSLKSGSKRAAAATGSTARSAPSRTKGAIVGALDSLAARMAVSLIEKLREPEPLPVSPEPGGLGYVDHIAPETEATGI